LEIFSTGKAHEYHRLNKPRDVDTDLTAEITSGQGNISSQVVIALSILGAAASDERTQARPPRKQAICHNTILGMNLSMTAE
jgi:hypothetical protein